MISVNITISGDRETLNKIRKIGQSFLNFHDALEKIGDRMESFYGNEVFASQGGILGEKWAALSPKYKLYKATGHTVRDKRRFRPSKMATFPGRGTLVRTGKMKSGFRHKTTVDTVEVYNRMPYFKYQQEGTERGLPARPMIGVNAKVKGIIQEIVQDDVRRKIARAGL